MIIFNESDIITSYSDKEILNYMNSSKNTLIGHEIIDEDNKLFYVDGDLDTLNNELEDYYIDFIKADNLINYVRDNIIILQGSNKDLYAIFNH